MEVNRNKASEYLILLFSTLIGMDFMISSGDFLMFYIGLGTGHYSCHRFGSI